MDPRELSPKSIIEATTGFMAARLFAAAMELGVFEHLGDECAVYSVGEISQWLEAARWAVGEHVALAGPASLVVGEAV